MRRDARQGMSWKGEQWTEKGLTEATMLWSRRRGKVLTWTGLSSHTAPVATAPQGVSGSRDVCHISVQLGFIQTRTRAYSQLAISTSVISKSWAIYGSPTTVWGLLKLDCL
jgi:hypothetical protein